MDPTLAAIVVAVVAALPSSLAVIVGLLNRREIKPGGGARETLETVAREFTSPDRNGDTLREEIQRIQSSLDEHIRQTEAALQGLGGTREDILARLKRLLDADAERHLKEGGP